MSSESAQLFYGLITSDAFPAALRELVADQVTGLTAALRGHVAAGDIGMARQLEGSIRALEDLPGVIRQYAMQFVDAITPPRS